MLAGEPWQVERGFASELSSAGKGNPEPAGPLPGRLPEAYTWSGSPAQPTRLEHCLLRNSALAPLGFLHHPKYSSLLEPPIPSLFSCQNTAASPQPNALPGQKGQSPTPAPVSWGSCLCKLVSYYSGLSTRLLRVMVPTTNKLPEVDHLSVDGRSCCPALWLETHPADGEPSGSLCIRAPVRSASNLWSLPVTFSYNHNEWNYYFSLFFFFFFRWDYPHMGLPSDHTGENSFSGCM